MTDYKTNISFVLDDQIVSIDFSKDNIKPTQTLLHYLRSSPFHKGTKEGCGEGDCGACTVVTGTLVNNDIKYQAVDSCLIFLPMLHGKQIITIENLEQKNADDIVLHPVQKAVIEENGTQCGFCTPGIVMSMFPLYKNYDSPTVNIIKDALSGNICRCTGYNSIIKAAQKSCKNKTPDHFDNNKNKIVKLLQNINNDNSTICIKTDIQSYFKVFDLNETLRLKNKYKDALIVSGATDCGLRVSKHHEILPLIIDISDVPEICNIEEKNDQFIIGAGAKIETIKKEIQKILPAFFDILSVFGSKQIRNMASLGGNIGSASPIGDTLPILFAYDAVVKLKSVDNEREIKISEFVVGYRKTNIKPDEIITHIKISKNVHQEYYIRSYKISKRKELDISTVSAAFRLNLKDDNIIEDFMAVYGGMAAYTNRAIETEKYLTGKHWNEINVNEAIKYIQKDFEPISDARAGKDMRLIAAGNLLKKFWLQYGYNND